MIPIRPARSGFTLVELLVTVGVIAVLLGILLPALTAARHRAAKTAETNRLRQVGIAWNLYANANDDSAIPGYLSPEPATGNVMDAWRVRYRFPDGQAIPAAEAAPWTFRLLQYLDFDQATLLDHLDLTQMSQMAMADYTLIDDEGDPDDPDDDLSRPRLIARHPGFGYNGFYLGGWWTIEDVDESSVVRMRFANARRLIDGAPAERASVVARSVATIRSPSTMVVFCSTTPRTAGQHGPGLATDHGSFLAVPPILANERLWNRSPDGGGEEIINVLGILEEMGGPVPIPKGRATGKAAILRGDLHIDLTAPGTLLDQREWINGAASSDFQHTP